MRIFANGLLTGLVLQTAIGPVFFFIINLALQRSLYDGLVAVVAVTLVDYFYISLAILGIGKLLEKKKVKKAFGIVSSVVLIIFGLVIIKGVMGESIATTLSIQSVSLLTSFSPTFFFSVVKKTVPIPLIQTLNIIVGSLLILYGAVRFTKVLKNSG